MRRSSKEDRRAAAREAWALPSVGEIAMAVSVVLVLVVDAGDYYVQRSCYNWNYDVGMESVAVDESREVVGVVAGVAVAVLD